MAQHTQDGWITCYRKSDGTELRLPEHVVEANKDQLTKTKPTTGPAKSAGNDTSGGKK